MYVIHCGEYLQKAAKKENLKPIPSVFSENHKLTSMRDIYMKKKKSTFGFVHASFTPAISVIIIKATTTPYGLYLVGSCR